MQLRVMMYIKSKKSAVFVLRVICTMSYKQCLNELQQHDLTGRLWNQPHKSHILLCYTAMSGNKQ